MKKNSPKIGVLGGGQLGRMLQEKALEYGINLYFLDGDPKAPCSVFANNFKQGSYRSRKDIVEFGREMDILTIEIEHVDADALEEMSKSGVVIIPDVSVIKMIKNKALQKQFYLDHDIPTSEFLVIEENSLDTNLIENWFPFVQKSQVDGYDGKGVAVIDSMSEISKELKVPSIIERKVNIEKELAVTIAIESNLQVKLFPICEMVFDPKLNLVDYVIAPANISKAIEKKVNEIAMTLANAIHSKGIFSIELFLDTKGQILVNEIAPRAHNSVHYTIEGCNISQYEAQLRILLDIPLPDIKMNLNAGMLNLVGEEGHHGHPSIQNIDKLHEVSNAHLHMYGKRETKPGRKMGHITVLNENREDLIKELDYLKEHIKIISNES